MSQSAKCKEQSVTVAPGVLRCALCYVCFTCSAERTIREAEGYSLGKINSAKGESEKFLSVLEEYKNAKEITKKRYYLETMMHVLPRAKQKYIIDHEQSSILPLLNIGERGGAQQ